jgi:hypothetical protein
VGYPLGWGEEGYNNRRENLAVPYGRNSVAHESWIAHQS